MRMAPLGDESFDQAIASFQAGRLDDAEGHFKKVLRHQPKHVAALNFLSVILSQLKRYSEAEPYIKLAVKLNANSDASFYNYGIILKSLNRPIEALDCFNRALSLNANAADTWNNRGTVLNDLKRYDEAIADFNRAIVLQPNYSEAFQNKAKSLTELKRQDEALAALDRALALKPDLAEAWVGRGNIFRNLQRHDEALAAYIRALSLNSGLADAWLGRGNVFYDLKRHDEAFGAYDKALSLRPDLAEAWLGRGNVHSDLKCHDDALAAYDKALTLSPDIADAWLGRGNVYYDLKRYDDALAAYDRGASLRPDNAEAWLGCGNVYFNLRRYDDALSAFDKALGRNPDLAAACLGSGHVFLGLKHYKQAFAGYDKALSLKPDLAEAWAGRGHACAELKRHDEALLDFDNALALKPNLRGVEGARLNAKLHLCDWRNLDAECAHLISSIRNGNANTHPFWLLAIPSAPADQLQCAKLWVATEFPTADLPIWQGERYSHDRIRIAYLSGDFQQHVVATLLVGLFECHDRSRFDVTALSLGPSDNSELRQRLEASVAHFIDVANRGDDEIAKLVRSLQIDILVDMMGFTSNSRPGILARKSAPVQVNFLGYLGTMGAPFIDYIIADRTVIPQDQREFYSEKIAYLPNSFQPTDQRREVATTQFSRAEAGLPQDGFVFCCFNANYKIAPAAYDVWMRILKRVDGSVLWLAAESLLVQQNLTAEAVARGVNAERLIFAPRIPLPEHQARLRLADLFLDTWPYNAGATASDTLWVGVPVLTLLGNSFVGRMAASVLNAIDLSELVAKTPEDYEALAIDLATNPDRLAEIKKKLADNRLTTPLFDNKVYAKDIEAAYTEMYERCRAENIEIARVRTH